MNKIAVGRDPVIIGNELYTSYRAFEPHCHPHTPHPSPGLSKRLSFLPKGHPAKNVLIQFHRRHMSANLKNTEHLVRFNHSHNSTSTERDTSEIGKSQRNTMGRTQRWVEACIRTVYAIGITEDWVHPHEHPARLAQYTVLQLVVRLCARLLGNPRRLVIGGIKDTRDSNYWLQLFENVFGWFRVSKTASVSDQRSEPNVFKRPGWF